MSLVKICTRRKSIETKTYPERKYTGTKLCVGKQKKWLDTWTWQESVWKQKLQASWRKLPSAAFPTGKSVELSHSSQAAVTRKPQNKQWGLWHTCTFQEGTKFIWVLITFNGNRHVNDQTTLYTSSRLFQNCKKYAKWLPLCPSRPILLSVCRYANPITSRTFEGHRLLAKGQRSSGQKRRFPSSPQINQNLCGIAMKTTAKFLVDQSLHHLNQNYQVLLHQNQVPSCSLPSLPPQSSTYATCHVHIILIEHLFAKPQANITKRMRHLVYHTRLLRLTPQHWKGIRFSRSVKAMAWSI